MTERVTTRVLGAIRPVGAPTRAPIVAPLSVTAPDVQFIRNRRGLFVFKHVPGLEAHEVADGALPTTPSIGSVQTRVTINDPSGHYLARTVTVDLPRDPNPANANSAESLFTPIDVELYPSPISGVDPGWAAIRVSVKRQGTPSGLPNAYLRVLRAGPRGTVLARGFADSRGEALIPVAGLPVVNWQSSPTASVLAGAIDAVLQAVFDPSQVAFPPDPASIEAHIDTLPSATANLQLASGRELATTIQIAVP